MNEPSGHQDDEATNQDPASHAQSYRTPKHRAEKAAEGHTALDKTARGIDAEFTKYTEMARGGALLREVETRYLPVLERVYELRDQIAAAKAELDLIEPRYIELYTELTEAAQTAFRLGATVKELAGHPLDRIGYWTLRNIVYRRDKPLKSVHFKLPPDPRKAPPRRTRPSQKKPKDTPPEVQELSL